MSEGAPHKALPMSTGYGWAAAEDTEGMDVPVFIVVMPHEITPSVLGVYFELTEAEAASEAADGFTVVDRSLLHA